MRFLHCILCLFTTLAITTGPAVAQSDSGFVGGFGLPGVDGKINSIAYMYSTIYVGGSFAVVGDEGRIFNLAAYDRDTKSWHAIANRGPSTSIGEIQVLATGSLAGDPVLYVGGDFINLDANDTLDYFAVYNIDEEQWSPLVPGGDNINDVVREISVSAGRPVYIGGDFTTAGEQSAAAFAWIDLDHIENGWQTPPAQLSRQFYDPQVFVIKRGLILNNTAIMLGGNFDMAGDSASKNIAIWDWDNEEWMHMPEGGVNGTVYDIEKNHYLSSFDTTVIYIAGYFFGAADSTNMYRVGQLTIAVESPGASISYWSSFGSGFNAPMHDIRSLNGEYYIAGEGAHLFNPEVRYFAKYDTTTKDWVDVGFNGTGPVYTLSSFSSSIPGGPGLFVVGDFEKGGGLVANSLVMYSDDGEFSTFGKGIGSGYITTMEADDSGNVYVGGSFISVGPYESRNFGVITDTGWIAFPNGPNQPPYDIAITNDSVFVAGNFTSVGGKNITRIAVYHDGEWFSVGSETFDSPPQELDIGPDGALYAAGSFSSPATYVGKWENNTWTDLAPPITGGSLTPSVTEIEWVGDDMVIAGRFQKVNDSIAPGVAIQRGSSSWEPLTDTLDADNFPGISSGSILHDMAADIRGRLYLAGEFSPKNLWVNIGGVWDSIDYNTCFGIQALELEGCNLYAGGELQSIDPSCVGVNLMRYNGRLWYDLGTLYGLDIDGNPDSGVAEINDLVVANNKLYIGGSFQMAGSHPSTGLAVYEGLPANVSGQSVQFVSFSDTLVYGDVAAIDFLTEGINELLVEYSVDSGKTWNILHEKHDAQKTLYWIVPDTNAAHCMLRTANPDFTCDVVYSQEFAISSDPDLIVQRLTRQITPFYTEPFVIGRHSWSFGNSAKNVWPKSVWEDYNYDIFAAAPDTNAFFPDWWLFCDAYGDAFCYMDVDTTILSPIAVGKWLGHFDGIWGGNCYGFTHSALLRFAGYGLNTGGPLPADNVGDYPLDSLSRNIVGKYWIYGTDGKYNRIQYDRWSLDPTISLLAVRDGFNSGDFVGLNFFWRTLDSIDIEDTLLFVPSTIVRIAGHSVLPYKIANVPDTAGIIHMYVYDNNRPNDTNAIIRINSNNLTYRYDPMKVQDTTYGLQPTLPIDEYTGYVLDPLNDNGMASPPVAALKSPTENHNTATIKTSGWEDILITDTTGQRAGSQNGEIILDDSTFGVIIQPDPEYNRPNPPGYAVPDGIYNIEMTNFGHANTRLYWESDSSIFMMRRDQADSSQTDHVFLDTGYALVSQDLQDKTLSLTLVEDYGGSETFYLLDDVTLRADDSLKVTPTYDTSLVIENYGSAKSYNLLVWQASADASQFIQVTTPITVESNVTHKLQPNWVDLEGEPIMILIDVDGDGIYDDTTLADIVTDIDDETGSALPDEYELGQNYPNPFNPSTTIHYSLPRTSDIVLEVINALGQKVRTLVDKNQPAGEYSVVWDGTGENGNRVASGIYFYRLRTGDRTKTRKMLLLK